MMAPNHRRMPWPLSIFSVLDIISTIPRFSIVSDPYSAPTRVNWRNFRWQCLRWCAASIYTNTAWMKSSSNRRMKKKSAESPSICKHRIFRIRLSFKSVIPPIHLFSTIKNWNLSPRETTDKRPRFFSVEIFNVNCLFDLWMNWKKNSILWF